MTFSKILLHSALFIATLFTTTVAGVAWQNIDPFELSNLVQGLPYSLSLLFILTCHEFGHYFAARYHGVDASLPFYIPFPPYLNPFGTMGAVIKTRSYIPNRAVLFDIGAYGPIAGFVATLIVLAYGFTHLPSKDFILTIHPEYYTKPAAGAALTFGSSLLYEFFASVLPGGPDVFVPPMSEMYHYPYLCAGWFGLFVTSLNMIPIGQSDGGHISYAMYGRSSWKISLAAMFLFLTLGIVPFLEEIGIPVNFGYAGWLIWPAVMFALNRGKLGHPEIEDETPLDTRRMLIGYLTLIIFIVSIMPTPISDAIN